MDVLKGVHNFVKKRRIISGALSHFGHPKLAKTARQLGYGRRRRSSKKVRRVRTISLTGAPAVTLASMRRRRSQKGRGRIGAALGGIAGGFLPF